MDTFSYETPNPGIDTTSMRSLYKITSGHFHITYYMYSKILIKKLMIRSDTTGRIAEKKTGNMESGHWCSLVQEVIPQ